MKQKINKGQYVKSLDITKKILWNARLEFWAKLKVVTNEKGEALGEVLTIIC
jgi:hypothetical protein